MRIQTSSQRTDPVWDGQLPRRRYAIFGGVLRDELVVVEGDDVERADFDRNDPPDPDDPADAGLGDL